MRFYIDPQDNYIQEISSFVRSSALLSRIHQKMAKKLQSVGIAEPNELVSVLAPDKSGQRHAYAMLWGFNTTDPLRIRFDAKLEGIDRDMRFRDDFLKHRCAIPCTFLLEKAQRRANNGSVSEGKEYVLQPSGKDRAYIGGIYRIEEGIPRCIILYKASSGEYKRKVSERIPLLVPEELVTDWISPSVDPKYLLGRLDQEILFEEFDPTSISWEWSYYDTSGNYDF